MSVETLARIHSKTSVDNNILIYAHDVDQAEKHVVARKRLARLMSYRSGVLSPQVLQEFYVNATRTMKKPITKDEARAIVDDFGIWCIDTTAAELSTAFRIEDEAKSASGIR